MSHNTTSGGGRTTRAVCATGQRSLRRVRKLRRKGRGRERSMRGPLGCGRQPPGASEVERQAETADFRLGVAHLGSALICSKSMDCRRSRSLTVITASSSGGASSCGRGCGRGGARASARRRLPGAGRCSSAGGVPSSKASAIACCAAFGSRQNRSKARSNSSRCSCRCTISPRNAALTWARLPRSTCSSACPAATTSAGPSGSPARRSSRAKWTMLDGSLLRAWDGSAGCGIPVVSGPVGDGVMAGRSG